MRRITDPESIANLRPVISRHIPPVLSSLANLKDKGLLVRV